MCFWLFGMVVLMLCLWVVRRCYCLWACWGYGMVCEFWFWWMLKVWDDFVSCFFGSEKGWCLVKELFL